LRRQVFAYSLHSHAAIEAHDLTAEDAELAEKKKTKPQRHRGTEKYVSEVATGRPAEPAVALTKKAAATQTLSVRRL
jgi:hypothetical protein